MIRFTELSLLRFTSEKSWEKFRKKFGNSKLRLRNT